MKEKTTGELRQILGKTRPENIGKIIEENKESLVSETEGFAEFIHFLVKQNGITLRQMFISADVPEKYGYKILSGEKHTVQRDCIIRLCIGAGATLDDMQKAIGLYGMAPLYPKFVRDSIIIVAINSGINDVNKIDELLENNDQEKLKKCGVAE